jgi:integrase-like protein
VLDAQPRIYPWVFTNRRTCRPYTVNGVAHVFDRAVARSGITSGDVTLHTLRHTALSRMIASGHDDYTVMEISGHSSTRMLARYTHPTEARKIGALNLSAVVTTRSQRDADAADEVSTAAEIAELLREVGGRREARTRDLRVANAALSQLS